MSESERHERRARRDERDGLVSRSPSAAGSGALEDDAPADDESAEKAGEEQAGA